MLRRAQAAESKTAAELARQLTVIETSVPSVLADPDINRGQLDEARMNRLFDQLAFGGMRKQRCLQTANF